MTLSVTILGSGTSTGVPVLGCHCEVCRSTDPRNTRWRASILVRTNSGTPIVIDTGPEFRLQLLRAGVDSLQNVLYTHMHADHSHGFDDLRGLFFNSQRAITCYMDAAYIQDLKLRFHYAFEDTGYLGGRPDITLTALPADGTPFKVADIEVETVRLPHGNVLTNAYRFGNFAYATDFKEFPKIAIDRWRGKIHTMVASGIRWKSHKTHSSIEETIELFKTLEVKRGIITHINHDVEYVRDSLKMPPGVELAFDAMTFQVPISP